MAATTRKTTHRPMAEAAASTDAKLSEAATDVRRTTRTAKSAAQSAGRDAQAKARKGTKAARAAASDAADQAARVIDDTPALDLVRRATHGASDLLDQVRGQARALGSSDLAQETRTVVRAYPLLSGVAALVAGFVLASAARGLAAPAAGRGGGRAR